MTASELFSKLSDPETSDLFEELREINHHETEVDEPVIITEVKKTAETAHSYFTFGVVFVVVVSVSIMMMSL